MKNVNPTLNKYLKSYAKFIEREDRKLEAGKKNSPISRYSGYSYEARERLTMFNRNFLLNLPKAELKRVVSSRTWNNVSSYYYYSNMSTLDEINALIEGKKTKKNRVKIMSAMVAEVSNLCCAYPKFHKFILLNGEGLLAYNALDVHKTRHMKTSSIMKRYDYLMRNSSDPRVTRSVIKKISENLALRYYKEICKGDVKDRNYILYHLYDRLKAQRVNFEGWIEQIATGDADELEIKSWAHRRQVEQSIHNFLHDSSEDLIVEKLSEVLVNLKRNKIDIHSSGNHAYAHSHLLSFVHEALNNISGENLLFFIDIADIIGHTKWQERIESKWT